MGYVNRKTDPFLQQHADRFPPMGKLGPPYTAATVVNNIFRKCALKHGRVLELMHRCACTCCRD